MMTCGSAAGADGASLLLGQRPTSGPAAASVRGDALALLRDQQAARHEQIGPVDSSEVVRQVDEAGLRLVRFLWCGNDGTVRAKASARQGLQAHMQSGIGVTVAMNAMNGLDQLQPVAGMGPVGETASCPTPRRFACCPTPRGRARCSSTSAR